jgi:transposase-like protein
VDARYEKVRVDGRVVSQGVLLVSGVRDDGFREILAVEVADTESEASYQELFRSLKARGLSGVELIVSDEHQGLKAAISRHFQGVAHQRCQVHYARNLLGMVSHAKRKELAADLRGIFAAPDSSSTLKLASSVANKWRLEKGNEKVSEHVEERIEECLSCLAFPESHRRRIRTTNGLERLNQEIKAAHASGKDLPQPRGVLEAGERLGHRAERGVADRQALPGYAGARRAAAARRAGSSGGSDARGAVEEELALEEITETSGLDPQHPQHTQLTVVHRISNVRLAQARYNAIGRSM